MLQESIHKRKQKIQTITTPPSQAWSRSSQPSPLYPQSHTQAPESHTPCPLQPFGHAKSHAAPEYSMPHLHCCVNVANFMFLLFTMVVRQDPCPLQKLETLSVLASTFFKASFTAPMQYEHFLTSLLYRCSGISARCAHVLGW